MKMANHLHILTNKMLYNTRSNLALVSVMMGVQIRLQAKTKLRHTFKSSSGRISHKAKIE